MAALYKTAIYMIWLWLTYLLTYYKRQPLFVSHVLNYYMAVNPLPQQTPDPYLP